VRDHRVAFLDLWRDPPPSAEEATLLALAAELVSDRLTLLSHRVETSALATITTTLALAGTVAGGAAACLDLVRDHTGAVAAMLARRTNGGIDTLGATGDWSTTADAADGRR